MSSIDYLQIVVLLLFMGFFAKGARMEQRSPVLWCALSLGMWLTATLLLDTGLSGGVLSQLLLIAGLTAQDMLRERKREAEANSRGPKS